MHKCFGPGWNNCQSAMPATTDRKNSVHNTSISWKVYLNAFTWSNRNVPCNPRECPGRETQHPKSVGPTRGAHLPQQISRFAQYTYTHSFTNETPNKPARITKNIVEITAGTNARGCLHTSYTSIANECVVCSRPEYLLVTPSITSQKRILSAVKEAS
jgi:hypothetical protein